MTTEPIDKQTLVGTVSRWWKRQVAMAKAEAAKRTPAVDTTSKLGKREVQVIAGDFKIGTVPGGEFHRGLFSLGTRGAWIARESVGIATVESLELLAQAEVKGWLVDGGEEVVTFRCRLKDGRSFMARTRHTNWVAMLASKEVAPDLSC